MHVFPRPADEFVFLAREPAAGECPDCGAAALCRYPVVSEGGWWMVVKCQGCLASIERTKWNRLGPLTLLADAV